VPVVIFRHPVEAYSDTDAELIEQPQVRFVESDPIRLHRDVHLDTGSCLPADRGHQVRDQVPASQQWLTAV
jgi:hypothetical protein